MLAVVGVFIVLAIAAVFWFAPFIKMPRPHPGHFVGATLLVAWTVGAGLKIYLDSVSTETDVLAEATRFGPIQWSEDPPTVTPFPSASGQTSGGIADVAPVQSLIGGLEARLANDPGDVKGWALLAQSYAFVGDSEGAENAIHRAVELGMDEAALRERVKLARREAQPTNWIREAVGG